MCYLFCRSFFFFFKPLYKITLFLNAGEIGTLPGVFCLPSEDSVGATLAAPLPVSFNTSCAVAGPTPALVSQSSISHSECSAVTGRREQHGHKSKVSREPFLHERHAETYCSGL